MSSIIGNTIVGNTVDNDPNRVKMVGGYYEFYGNDTDNAIIKNVVIINSNDQTINYPIEKGEELAKGLEERFALKMGELRDQK